jgi:diacylglycerol kinase (ATP)
MDRKFIILVNPVSGTGNRHSLQRLIEEKMEGRNIPYQILVTDPDGNYVHLTESIKREEITDVIICGGDGTINKIAAHLCGSKVNIGIVPMGSGNGLAFAAGIPRDPSRAMDIIFGGKSSYIDAFHINDQFSCMLCGLGFDAQVAHDFAKQNTRGLATYIRQTIRNFFASKPYRFILHVNDKKIESEAFFISVANSNQFGNNVKIAPKASLNDGLLDVVVVSKMSKLRLVYTLLKQIRFGRVLPVVNTKRTKGVYYFQTDAVNIQNPDGAPFHIDGEPSITATSFDIRIIRDALMLIQP